MENIDEINDLLKNCINTDGGITSIYHSYYDFNIYDISQFTVEKINEMFLKRKIYIDKIKNLDKDLQEFIRTNENGITSIYHYKFELIDISKYTSEEINESFSKQKLLLDNYIKSGQYKEYTLSIPERVRVSTFHSFTKNPDVKRTELWDIDDKDYWEFLRFLWLEYSEDVFSHRDSWWFLYRSKRSKKEFFMSESERTYLQKLPNEFIVYRGYSRPKPTDKMKPENLRLWNVRDSFSRMGFSYTLSKEVGLKYYKKYEMFNRENPPQYNYYKMENDLFEGKVLKDKVLFYINDKNEEEIIIVDEYSSYGSPY